MVSVKGWNAKVLLDGVQVGKCSTASVDFDTNLDEFYSIGYQSAQVEEGTIRISGSMERLWIDNSLLSLLGGGGGLVSFELEFQITNGPSCVLYACKLEKASINLDAEGYSTTPVDFRAETFSLS